MGRPSTVDRRRVVDDILYVAAAIMATHPAVGGERSGQPAATSSGSARQQDPDGVRPPRVDEPTADEQFAGQLEREAAGVSFDETPLGHLSIVDVDLDAVRRAKDHRRQGSEDAPARHPEPGS